MVRLGWTLLAFLLVAQPATASLLWKLEKNGNIHYLFGTIHVSDADIIALKPEVQAAVDAAQRLVVEAVVDDKARQAMADRSLLSTNTLKGVLGPDLFEQVARAAKARNLMPASVMRLKPWAVALMLNMPTPSLKPVLDVHLQYRFQDSRRPVSGLETVDEQLAIFDEMSLADQIEFLKVALLQQDEFDANFAHMKTLYLAGDLTAIEAFSEQQINRYKQPVLRKVMHRILAERNVRMFQRVQPHLARSGTLIAVGALHLPGNQGLLAMFRQAGYTLTPVQD